MQNETTTPRGDGQQERGSAAPGNTSIRQTTRTSGAALKHTAGAALPAETESEMHTPGPWTVESDGTTVTMGGQCVITAPAPDHAGIEEQRANAALIAAAPDLLAVCRDLVVQARMLRTTERTIAKANAIIARAEGK